jgi:lipase ATG15
MFPALPLLLLLAFAAHAALAGAAELSFELRHAHAVSVSGQVVFADVPRTGQRSYPDERPQRGLSTESEPAHVPLHIVPTRRTTIFRAPHNAVAWPRRRRPGPDAGAFAHPQSFPEDAAAAPGWWTADEVDGPDVSRRSALLELAKMTNNAYLNPNETGWYELGAGWTVVRARRYMYTGGTAAHPCVWQSYPFGWEPDADGFRGHVFATPDNATVVLAIKGTSGPWIGGGGPTTKKVRAERL